MEEAGTGKDASPMKNFRRVVFFVLDDTLHQRAVCINTTISNVNSIAFVYVQLRVADNNRNIFRVQVSVFIYCEMKSTYKVIPIFAVSIHTLEFCDEWKI